MAAVERGAIGGRPNTAMQLTKRTEAGGARGSPYFSAGMRVPADVVGRLENLDPKGYSQSEWKRLEGYGS
jgi:hypothetical protein